MRLFLSVSMALAGCVAAVAEDGMRVWLADPLVKVFRDDPAQALTPIPPVLVARGQTATFQVVARAEVPLTEVRAAVAPFADAAGHTIAPDAARFVGYVNVDRPMQTPSADRLRTPPFDFPDPLLEVSSIEVAAGQTQPVWVTVPIPLDAMPGPYASTVHLTALLDGVAVAADVPVALEVYPVTLDKTRLWVTQWFNVPADAPGDAPDTGLRKMARMMAKYRQNVALISPLGLAKFSVSDTGGLAVDFADFDKRVRIFQEEGMIGRIEGGHFGGREEGWLSKFHFSIRQVKDGAVVSASVAPDSAEADAFYGWFLPLLVAHLKENGWLDSYMQHLADEPILTNADSYRAMAALVRKYAPELRIVEANHTRELAGSMNIWVPQLNYLQADKDFYAERQAAGDEVWFYTCVFPQGEYANRFIELPLIKTRLLHWINFRYGATGYLHWGFNQFAKFDPYTQTTTPHTGPPYLPAGDPWIVYPAKEGNGLWASLRLEAMRDGIEDHELLSRLAEKDAAKAHALAERLVLDYDKYNTNPEDLYAARKELLAALSADATAALLEDPALECGFRLSTVDSSAKPNVLGDVLRGDGEDAPAWRLSQWGTRFSLEGVAETHDGGVRALANEGKDVRVFPGGLAGEGVLLAVHGIAEYGGHLRQQGEPWPHLLVEQKFHDPVRPAMLGHLDFGVEFNVTACATPPDIALDPGLHTAQCTAYWTVHNGNPASPDYPDMFWFGVPLFDARYPVPPGHQALDTGKADATNKFIRTIPGDRFFQTPIVPGEWRRIACDLAPLLREALAAAQTNGYLTHTVFEELSLTTFNLGWEVPGPYECAVHLRGLRFS